MLAALKNVITDRRFRHSIEQRRRLEVVSWKDSRMIFADRRVSVEQPTGETGLVLAFRNNTIHKGGFPAATRVRYVSVFHVCPSTSPLAHDTCCRFRAANTGALPAELAS
ncbi:MAG: hypothetical protein WC815_07915 [Vicinamibacterales bacterium]|jgi:hypothetical protein